MAKRRRRRKEETSSEEDNDSDSDANSSSNSNTSSSEASSSNSSSSPGLSSDNSSDNDSSAESDDSDDASSVSGDDDDDGSGYAQLLDLLTKAGLKSAAKKLVAKRVFSVAKARTISTSTLVRKFGIKEAEAKTVRKLLNDPSALLPQSSESDTSSSDDDHPSDDEDELVWRVLRSIDQTALIKVFKKNKIANLKQAYKITDRKLKKFGIENKQTREIVLREFEKKKNNKTSSEEEEEVKLAKILKAIDMKRYIKFLQRGKITDLDSAYNLTSSSLKSLGIASSRDRRRIIAAIGHYKDSHAEDDPQLAKVKRALGRLGLQKLFPKLKSKGINSIKKLKGVDHSELREIGIQMYRERKDVLEKLEIIDDQGNVEKMESESSNGSDQDSVKNVVNDILRSQYMSRHIPDFKRANIRGLKEARKLSQTQLRAMGVAKYLDREKLINAFKDYRPKNPDIVQILRDVNLAKHSPEFEKLIDVDDAKCLTHADLRAMGINLYGQRDRLIKAFASFDAKDNKKGRRRRGGS